MGKIPKNNFNSCDDFIEIVITAHILCAALETMGMESLDSIPSQDQIPSPETVWTKTDNERKEILESLLKYCDEAYSVIIYCSASFYH